MASTTIPLEDINKYADTIYEAVVIIAKRARQINDEQKRVIETTTPFEDDADDYYEEDEEENDKKEQRDYIKLPKPTKIAIEEFLSGKLKFEYIRREESI